MPSELPRPGDVIRQKYSLERVLGQGGMAVIFAAEHLHLRQRVALKLMRPDIPREGAVVERFLREARAVIRLESPHVARVLDVDTLDDGTPFIVMEYLEGSDLLVLLGRRRLAIDEAVRYAREACEGIAEAHALGIIHRDVKPANLFLAEKAGASPVVKVLDFGISKVLEDTRITAEQLGMGSAEYMSPEQIREATSVDLRSDIWSLGVTLYELCTGDTPFRAPSMSEVIAGVLARTPKPPKEIRAEIPPGLDAVILRCLEKDPSKRFASASELAAALAPYATAAGAHPPAAGGAKPNLLAVFVAVALAVVIAALVTIGLLRRANAPDGPRFQLQDEAVVDSEAKLTWQRTPAPAAMDWAAAKAHCAEAGEGFRLPEAEELESLLTMMAIAPPLDPENFSSTALDVFWTKTQKGPGAALVVNFAKQKTTESVVSTRNRVRCVR